MKPRRNPVFPFPQDCSAMQCSPGRRSPEPLQRQARMPCPARNGGVYNPARRRRRRPAKRRNGRRNNIGQQGYTPALLLAVTMRRRIRLVGVGGDIRVRMGDEAVAAGMNMVKGGSGCVITQVERHKRHACCHLNPFYASHYTYFFLRGQI